MRLQGPVNVFLFLSTLLALAAPAIGAESAVTIAQSIPYAPGGEQEVVRAAVRNECQLQAKLSEAIAANAKKRDLQVIRSSEDLGAASGRVLKIEITKAIARAGGLYSGLKRVEVRGTLVSGEEVLGSFEGKRSASGGMFAQFRSTCGIVQKCVKVLGADIAAWLEHPSEGAYIGELGAR